MESMIISNVLGKVGIDGKKITVLNITLVLELPVLYVSYRF